MALIRSEDFGPFKNYTKVWFTCDDCNIGVLQLYKTYLKQKDKKLCRACRNSYSQSFPDIKEKHSNRLKKQWANNEYRKSMSTALSIGCKETWDRDDGSRRKLVSEITSQSLKEKWQTEVFRNNQVIKQKAAWSNETLKSNASKISKDLWENFDHRKKQMDSREKWRGEPAHNRHTYEYIETFFSTNKYELLSKKYHRASEKLQIKCPENHLFEMRYGDFRDGHRCPYCSKSKQFSNAEKEIGAYIKSFNFEIIENNRNIIPPLELDIAIPEKKIAIEYCGLYWHSEDRIDKNYHLNKLEKCKEQGYRLITIFEDEWFYKEEIIKNRLKHILGRETEKIYARKCNLSKIDNLLAKFFIDQHHLQGYKSSTICLGAYYTTELVAVMTFTDLNNGVFELNRFCVNKNVVGIASKLLEHFKRNYKWKKIISFADKRWSEGNLYEKLGFSKEKILTPDYSYFRENRIRFHKFNFRHAGMKNKLENYNPELSESVNMKNNGWSKIYDCGKIRYVYTAN